MDVTPNRVAMIVLRDGYFDGAYPRVGETITVDHKLVEPLEQSGFAMRVTETTAAPVVSAPRAKGDRTHGR